MADQLKNMFNYNTIRAFAERIHAVYDAFPVDRFMEMVLDDTWEELELKARARHISIVLHQFLPNDYEEVLRILLAVADHSNEILGWVLTDYVELYGQDDKDWDKSVEALGYLTQFSSSEFAVRPFIIKDEKRMMEQMLRWSTHDNEDIRRLASEGCRPALPWAMAIPSFKIDPSPVLPILETLKNDPSEYVRRSVANNLNDIAKTHPDLVAALAKQWLGQSREVDWVVKHGCRTLLKKGNREVLDLFGFHQGDALVVSNFRITSDEVVMGEEIMFAFTMEATEETRLRLEYGIDFMKANGKKSRKVFQISESTMKSGEVREYIKSHSFKEITTRKHYTGEHDLTLIVNGEERAKGTFVVTS